MRALPACHCHAAAAERPRISVAASNRRSAKHQRRALMLFRRAAAPSSSSPSNETSTSTSPAPPPPIISSAVVGQIVPFRAAPVARERVTAPPGAPVIVILPGFGNDAFDYTSSPLPTSEEKEEEKKRSNSSPLSSLLASLFSSSSPSSSARDAKAVGEGEGETTAPPRSPPPPQQPPSLASALEARGFLVSVVPVKRSDWFRVARCAVDPAYWRGEAKPETAYGWYLDAAESAVEEAALSNPFDSGVVLLAHSAGGWLGRALVGRGGQDDSKSVRSHVRALCTLGTPHAHNEAARCVTGGALARVNELWPGAFFSSPACPSEGEEGGEEEEIGNVNRIRYVAVAGRAVVGDAFAPRGTAARAAAAAYSQVAGGDGHGVAGDGVVPLSAATLPGAVNVVLDGVFHAPRRQRISPSGGQEGEGEGGGGNAPEEEEERRARSGGAARWFGEEAVVDSWLHVLVKALEDE